MAMANEVKTGIETSEYKVAKSGSFWSTLTIVLGAVIAVGSVVTGIFGADSTVGLVVGAVVTVVGNIQKLLTDKGYIASRTAVKEAAIKKETNNA